jgi:glycerophosphoryl diester phosphodiesterase
MGADFLEPDLVSSKDGVLVARHENALSRTTDVAGRAEFADHRTTRTIEGVTRTDWFTEDFTAAELSSLGVLSFAEVLALAAAHGVGVYPETKYPLYFDSLGLSLEEPLLAALRSFAGPVFIQSFVAANLIELRSATSLPLVRLLAGYEDLDAIARYADAIGPAKLLLTPELVAGAHARGLAVHSWTYRDDEAEYERAFDLGVDGVFSDFPDRAVAVRLRRNS